jgi:hypothetical protein
MLIRMFEVTIPANLPWVYLLDNRLHASFVAAFRRLFESRSEVLLTRRTHQPHESSSFRPLEAVTEEVEVCVCFCNIYDAGLFGVEFEFGLLHPFTNFLQDSFGFTFALYEDDDVICVTDVG